MPGGQPTLYRPEFCEDLERTMAQGDTLACFAADHDVSRDTCYAWMSSHTEFSDAHKKGQQKALKFWERMLGRCAMGMPIKIDGKEYKNYNVVAMIFLMKARFKDYQEQQKIQSQEMNHDDPDSLTIESISIDQTQS